MATHNEKEVKSKYPVEIGLTAGTTKQIGNKFLNTGVRTFVSCKDRVKV